MFEFIFQGNQEQFDFFKKVVFEKVPDAELKLDFINPVFKDEFNCSMSNEPKFIFQVGMILSACYSKFGHLALSKFSYS